MASLSSSISLALAVKLKRLFETSPDKFLSFPTGLAFPTSFFNFMRGEAGGLSAVEQHNFQVEFARLTNRLPQDVPTFPQDSSQFLWDVYKHTLLDSIFADSTLTPAQSAQLDAAIDFLTDKQTVDGADLFVPSAAVRAYYEHKTVYDDLNRQYLDEKLTVEFTPNDAEGQQLREAWKQGREAMWRDQIDEAENNWINLGFRDAVKQQQFVRAELEPKRFPAQFKAECLSNLALADLPDLNANGLPGGYSTFFSPNNIFAPATPWPSVTLSKAEIRMLAAQAPPELISRFSGDAADSSIERLSFEYNKVVTIRPWLDVNFITARSWKLPNDALLSDGNVPRKGSLPAYVSSLVVVRNIRVTRLQGTTTGQPLIIPIISKEHLNKFKVRPTYESPPINPKQPEVMLQARSRAVVAEAAQPRPAVLDHRQRLQQAAYQGTTITTPTRVPIRVPTKNGPNPTTAPTTTPQRPPIGTGQPGPRPMPQYVEEKFNFDGVVIVAFDCTRLPKSPNPDPTLPWSTP